MAIIKCPECEQSISDKAIKCPKCGYPVQEYLSKNYEEMQIKNSSTPPQFKCSTNVYQVPTQKKSKSRVLIRILTICGILIAALVLVFSSQLFTARLTVKDISINKWRLTDSTEYFDYYEGTVTSEQKKPFVAVLGQYEDEECTPQLVYVDNGIGTFETIEDLDEDPSIKYRAIGYMSGSSVKLSDINVTYSDSNYSDWSYSDSSSCEVQINIDMNNSKTGVLVFDLINETNNDTDKNLTAIVFNGKAEYIHYADLPYKARGIEVSIVPKLFCESDSVAQEDYAVEKEYTTEKYLSSYLTSYSGEETRFFADYADGFVLYSKELKEGGNKVDRNIAKYSVAFLHDGECTFTTYDYVDGKDITFLKPRYEFNIIGYVTWKPLEREKI